MRRKETIDSMLCALADDCDDADDEFIFLLLAERRKIASRQYQFNLNGYSDEEARVMFRFSKAELSTLLSNFAMPSSLKTTEGCRVSATEALCITLRRLAFPIRYVDM